MEDDLSDYVTVQQRSNIGYVTRCRWETSHEAASARHLLAGARPAPAATRAGPHAPTSTALQRIFQPSCRQNSASRSIALLADPSAPGAPALRPSRATIRPADGPHRETPPAALPGRRRAFPWRARGPSPKPGASAARQSHKSENGFRKSGWRDLASRRKASCTKAVVSSNTGRPSRLKCAEASFFSSS